MNAPIAPVQHIMIDDDGIPRTIHRSVKVKMIAQKHFVAGESVEAIAIHYDISMGDVYAALAYFHDNQAYFAQQDQALEPLSEQARSYSTALRDTIVKRMQERKPDET